MAATDPTMLPNPPTNPHTPSSSNDSPLVGIEIGGTKLQIVLASSPTTIIDRWRGAADRAGGGAAIQRQIAGGLTTLLAGRRPRAIGVGFGGPIDVAVGRIRRSHQIAGWEGFPLRDWIAEHTSAPVAVENDSNAAALAEATHGAAAGDDPVFYCNFGSGVGGGFVTGGNIYHGVPPGEMEFGHLRLKPFGITVEQACSGWEIDRSLRRAAVANPTSSLAARLGSTEGGEARHLAALVRDGDKLATEILDLLAGHIAFGLSHVIHLLHPQTIVIGGGLALVGEPLRFAIEALLPAMVMEAFHPVPPVRLTKLTEDAVPIGALELAARIANI